jgi:hypothetical protein
MIVNTGLRRFTTRGSGSGANAASLDFDFVNSPSLTGNRGGTITEVRATTATYTDQDLIVRTALAGQARMQGVRIVRNLLPLPEAISGVGWTKVNATVTSGIADPLGGTSAFTYTSTNASSFLYVASSTIPAGNLSLPSVYARRRTGTGQFTLRDGANTDINVSGVLTTSWQRLCIPASTCTSSVQDRFVLSLTTSGDAVDIWHPQLEDVTGQSIQTPGEYQSVGVLSTPYQGLGVDGARAYTTLNGNTVASNVVTEATGAVISSAIRQGFLVEAAATDLLTARADARDMTTANWTLGVTMTRARTSVGMDGTANTATRLTGGAVAATNTILTTITAAASSRTYSVGLKRVTGTGTISICQDGATFTDITSQLNSSTFTVVQLNASQLNAQLGIKISTNGDAIDADWNQFEAGALATSRIPTAISTRNADVATIATGSWHNALAGTLYAEWLNINVSGTYAAASLNDTTANERVNIYTGTITTAGSDVFVGGVSQSNISAVSITGGAVAKVVSIYKANDFAGFANNTSLGTDTSGSVPTVTRLELGSFLGGFQINSTIRGIKYFPRRLSNTVAQGMTV